MFADHYFFHDVGVSIERLRQGVKGLVLGRPLRRTARDHGRQLGVQVIRPRLDDLGVERQVGEQHRVQVDGDVAAENHQNWSGVAIEIPEHGQVCWFRFHICLCFLSLFLDSFFDRTRSLTCSATACRWFSRVSAKACQAKRIGIPSPCGLDHCQSLNTPKLPNR